MRNRRRVDHWWEMEGLNKRFHSGDDKNLVQASIKMTLNAKIKKYEFYHKSCLLPTGSQLLPFYLNCPLFYGIWSEYKQFRASGWNSEDLTQLYYLPSTVSAARDDDKSLKILKWASGITTTVGDSQ